VKPHGWEIVPERGLSNFEPSPRLSEAFEYARSLHAGQVRKGTTIPYLAHLLAVASLVVESGGNEDDAIAALLHDAIEDQGHDGRTRYEIARKFGDGVLRVVEACTDADEVPKPPWRQRKEAYLAHLKTAPIAVRRLVAADKLHNARAILADHRRLGDGLWSRFNAPRQDQLWYYRGCVTALRQADTGREIAPLVDELDAVVTTIEEAAS